MKDPLRIHWFSPVPPARTGIAEVTAALLPALAKHAEVTLWTSQREWQRELQDHAQVKQFNGEREPLPSGPRDICFYNLGNHRLHHADILKASLRQPGVVVMHDLYLQDLRLASEVKEYLVQAGEPAPASGDAKFEGLGIERARGAVAHTRAAVDSLALVKLQTLRADLPYVPRPNRHMEERRPRWVRIAKRTVKLISKERADSSVPRRLTIFGFLSWNRRLESIIQALACMPERAQFHLDIFGEVNEPHVRPLARASGLRKNITFHGFVSDAVLDNALARTDLAINLRHPTMGESSLSQLRIWAHSCPSIVTREGWYAELDSDVVDFVSVDHEIEDLQRAFRRLLVSPEHFSGQGARGYQRLISVHDPERYARDLVRFAEHLLDGSTKGSGYE